MAYAWVTVWRITTFTNVCICSGTLDTHPKVRETMARAAAKVEDLKEYDVVKDSTHVGAIMAYTDETELYAELIVMAYI